MKLLAGAAAVFLFSTVTCNVGNFVYLNDGSFSALLDTSITGNLSGLDVDCDPQFPITRGIKTTGGIANCVEPAGNSKLKALE
jgi:hypothetical protein